MGSERPDLGSSGSDFGSKKPYIELERPDLGSKRPDLRPKLPFFGLWGRRNQIANIAVWNHGSKTGTKLLSKVIGCDTEHFYLMFWEFNAGENP